VALLATVRREREALDAEQIPGPRLRALSSNARREVTHAEAVREP
jgi:hypothetical protein